VNAFKRASKDATDKMKKTGGWTGVPESTQNVIAFSEAFSHVIDSEPVSHYIGKVRLTASNIVNLSSIPNCIVFLPQNVSYECIHIQF